MACQSLMHPRLGNFISSGRTEMLLGRSKNSLLHWSKSTGAWSRSQSQSRSHKACAYACDVLHASADHCGSVVHNCGAFRLLDPY